MLSSLCQIALAWRWSMRMCMKAFIACGSATICLRFEYSAVIMRKIFWNRRSTLISRIRTNCLNRGWDEVRFSCIHGAMCSLSNFLSTLVSVLISSTGIKFVFVRMKTKLSNDPLRIKRFTLSCRCFNFRPALVYAPSITDVGISFIHPLEFFFPKM